MKLVGKFVRITIAICIIIWGIRELYIEFYNHEWKYVTPTDKQIQKYSISSNQALALYQLMKDTHEILTSNDIAYWIESGTLLGAVRHMGVIPFDDDLDIGIQHNDEIKLQKTFSTFRKLDYKILHDKFYSVCSIVCIDIFIYHKVNNKFVYTNLLLREKFPNHAFYINELFPLQKYKFGELEVYGPNKYEPCLDRQYPEWSKYAVIHQPHSYRYRLSGIERKTKFILTPRLLEPAMPCAPLQNRVL